MKLTTGLGAIAVLLIAIPANLYGQSDDWTGVRTLKPGTDLIVMRKNSGRVVGYVQSVSDDTIAITSNSGSSVIGKDNIKKIYYAVPRSKKKSLNRGALYGMLLGLLVGGVISAAHEPEGQEVPGLGAFLAGSAIGIWAGNRHAKGKDKGALIYSAR